MTQVLGGKKREGSDMELYALNMKNAVIGIPVVKETPKGYVLEPVRITGHRKFLRKADDWSGIFPTHSMAVAYMRDILKARICMAHEEVVRLQVRLDEAKADLTSFDETNNVVSASGECSVNMRDYLVDGSGGVSLVRDWREKT